MKQRITEAFYIARFHPEIKLKQPRSISRISPHIVKFPLGIGRYVILMQGWPTFLFQNLHSDEDLKDRKHLVYIVLTAFYLLCFGQFRVFIIWRQMRVT